MVTTYDKAMFVLALSGSILFLFQQIFKGLSVLFAGRSTKKTTQDQAAATGAPAPAAAPAAEAVPATPEALPKSAVEKNLVLLLERQNYKLEELTKGLALAQQRLSMLESPKTRASRKAAPAAELPPAPVAEPVEHDGYPPVESMSAIPESTPGGFEKV
jgi:hypothetical protein